MTRNWGIRNWLTALYLAVGTLALIGILVMRTGWDAEYRKVMLVFDATTYGRLARDGVTLSLPSPAAIGVNEATVRSLRELGYMTRVASAPGTGDVFLASIPSTLLFDRGRLNGEKLAARIKRSLSYQLTDGFDVQVAENFGMVGTPSFRVSLVLPPLPEEQTNALALGFYVQPSFPLPESYAYVFRPNGNGLYDRAGLEEKFSWIPDHPHASSLVIFSGTQVPGFPGGLADTAELFTGDLGLVEFSKTDGDRGLAARLKPSSIYWVHSIPQEEMPPLSPLAMKERYLRALRERNPRVLYLHPISPSLAIQPAETLGIAAARANQEFLDGLAQSIRDELKYEVSLEPANPSADPPLFLRAPVVLLVYLGVMWFVLIFLPGGRLETFFHHPATMLAAIPASFVVAASDQLRGLAALAAALAFPLVGIGYAFGYTMLLRRNGRTLPGTQAVTAFAVTFVFALLGGLIVQSLIISVAAFTKIEFFHGVLLSRSLPVLLILAYAFNLNTMGWAPAARSMYARINRLMAYPFTALDMALVFILAAALALAMMRAGNEFGFLVSQSESSVRGNLERLFAVRPRTTEIAGHFALLWFFTLMPWSHRSLLLLLAAGMLGMCSVVNTFSHLHTPVLVSMYRSEIGLILGLAAFVVTYFIWWLVRLISIKLGGQGGG
jgi:hypothetical protein